MTTARTDAAIERAFVRTGKILDAIEAGEDPQPAIDTIAAAQPWDLVNIGQAFVLDEIQTDRESDGTSS